MVYFVEYNQLFEYTQSAYRIVHSTIDPLIRLVVDINMGFNKKPFEYTLLLKLDLISAFNHIEHNKLLEIMINVSLPPCFVKFHKGFLNYSRFKVWHNMLISSSVKESCRSSQGAVSSP